MESKSISKCYSSKYNLLRLVFSSFGEEDKLFTEYSDWICKLILSIEEDETFYKILVFLNKNSYIGYFSLLYNFLLKNCLHKEDKDGFIEVLYNFPTGDLFLNKSLSEEYHKKLNDSLYIEICSLNMLLERASISKYFPISWRNLDICRKEIEKETSIKSLRLTKIIKYKGRDYGLSDFIIKCEKNIFEIDSEVKDILSNYKNEVIIVREFLKLSGI